MNSFCPTCGQPTQQTVMSRLETFIQRAYEKKVTPQYFVVSSDVYTHYQEEVSQAFRSSLSTFEHPLSYMGVPLLSVNRFSSSLKDSIELVTERMVEVR